MDFCPLVPDSAPLSNYLNLVVRLHNLAKSQTSARPDRTGTSTYSVFGETLRFDLAQGFPLLTARRLPWKSVCTELCWFLDGRCDLAYLTERGCKFWDGWASASGALGPIYGVQWRSFNGIDQISQLVYQLVENPYSRRHVVSAWNPCVLPLPNLSPQANADHGLMSLAPCHYTFQCYVTPPTEEGRKPKLSLQFNMRSSDVFIGLPNNIASYALLTHLLALICDFEVGELLYVGTDVHIYSNHLEACQELLDRAHQQSLPSLPKLNLPYSVASSFESPPLMGLDPVLLQRALEEYNPLPTIAAPLAI